MGAAPAIAKPVPGQAATLEPKEADTLAGLHLARPQRLIDRFRRGFAFMIKTVSHQEFVDAAEAAIVLTDGRAIEPDQAAKRAQRIVQAATGGDACAMCQKCDKTETAMLTFWLGEPKAGFFINRAITLKDPKGAKRG